MQSCATPVEQICNLLLSQDPILRYGCKANLQFAFLLPIFDGQVRHTAELAHVAGYQGAIVGQGNGGDL
jgi:hypothetical protein